MSHIGLEAGQASPRLLLVGDEGRARRIAEACLEDVTEIRSPRGFLTLTGTFHSHRLTIMATGMGYPMMDFAVRELIGLLTGPMWVIRLGTCGLIKGEPEDTYGSALVCDLGAVLVRTNLDCCTDDDDCKDESEETEEECYRVSGKVLMPDADLTARIKSLANQMDIPLLPSLTLSCDSFYSSQGRPSLPFQDHNAHLLPALLGRFGAVPRVGMEMETGQLVGLAQRSSEGLRVGAVHIVVADRTKAEAIGIDEGLLHSQELRLGRLLLTVLSQT